MTGDKKKPVPDDATPYLSAISPRRLDGREAFHVGGTALPQTLAAFWQWSASDLIGNTLRGVLAEYIVALDLGCASGVRQEWQPYDLVTDNGIKVEVKSASYLQGWHQRRPSRIVFDIRPTVAWDRDTNSWAAGQYRQSDAYVFCLFAHRDRQSVDVLNLAQWVFYILPTKRLNEAVGLQKTISLSRLQALNPVQARYGDIANMLRDLMPVEPTARSHKGG